MASDHCFIKNIEKLADSLLWFFFLINKIVMRMNLFVNRPWNNHAFYRIHAIVLSPLRQRSRDWLILYSNAAIKSRSRRMLPVVCSSSLARCSSCKSPWNEEQAGRAELTNWATFRGAKALCSQDLALKSSVCWLIHHGVGDRWSDSNTGNLCLRHLFII